MLFVDRGWNVVATMRNPDDGAELADRDNVLVTALDYRVPGTPPTTSAHRIGPDQHRFGTIVEMNDDRDRRYITPVGEPDPNEVAAFWTRYLNHAAADKSLPVPPAWCFGDTVELANDLIDVVIHGPKRATAGAVAEYEADSEPLPTIGDISVVTDGTMRPRAVLRTTEVRVGPLSSVDDQFAWDEGEGDRTRSWWLDAHSWCFTRSFARLGLKFDREIPVVFERFVLCYHED